MEPVWPLFLPVLCKKPIFLQKILLPDDQNLLTLKSKSVLESILAYSQVSAVVLEKQESCAWFCAAWWQFWPNFQKWLISKTLGKAIPDAFQNVTFKAF